tara:strand:+ start:97 stop:399 length:303 start_codon:yes stop_codon:yes gene_type:complete
MGYYTRYELEILHGNDNVTDYEQEISEASDYNSCFYDEIKWYSHKLDMIEYSKKHPDTLFKLTGEGEDQPDMWQEYYKNGKTHRIEGVVFFEEFHIEALG